MTGYRRRLAEAQQLLGRWVRAWMDRFRPHWTPELGDAVFYAVGACFAGITAIVSTLSLYRVWGEIAAGPYLAAAGIALLLWRRRMGRSRSRSRMAGAIAEREVGVSVAAPPSGVAATQPAGTATGFEATSGGRWRLGPARAWLLVAVLIGATLVPLGVEIAQRGHGQTTAHVQPEVVVIDQAGARLAHGLDPYHALVRQHHLISAVPGEPAYESFFPYLPLMAVFGLPTSRKQPVQLTDTRIFFSLVTLAVAGLALAMSGAPKNHKVRALQVVAVLPSAALPLATGGDDMPVVALLLLAMVLAQRRRPGWSGVVLGIVSAMKFTAWPMAALALFAARDRSGRRAPGWMLAGMAVVAGPVVAPFAASNLNAFFSNVILFPLGLSGVPSPAASDLPGHLLVLAFPWLERALPLGVGLIGGAYLVHRLWRRPPATASTVAYLSGWVMLVALAFAPATRVGYLLYPANFFIWGWMFDAERRATPTVVESMAELVPA